jgi:cation diffusion facilitator family transporter
MHSHSHSHEKESVALSSVFASIFLTATKFTVGIVTGSMGIISEAAHSLLDLFAAGLTFFSVKFSGKPADKEHPYGYGKIESVSALIETGLLFLTSGWIIFESIKRLITKNTEIELAWYAFAVIILSIIIDLSRSRSLYRVAKKTNSQALEADALHFSSDIYSSLVVLLGLICVAFGIPGADAIAAICVSIFIAFAGYKLGKKTIDTLIDYSPQETCNKIKEITENTTGIISVEKVRARIVGNNTFIEMTICVSRGLPISKVKEIEKEVCKKVCKELPNSEIVIESKPVQLDNETIIETIHILSMKNNLPIHDIIVDKLDDKRFISYDVEVPDNLNVQESHELTTILENEIKEELGRDIELNSHIEPMKKESILSSNVTKIENDEITKAIKETDREVPELSCMHNTLIRKIGNKYFVSLHCCSDPELSIENVHNATNRFEYLIKNKVKEIKRVVIHVEPKEKNK